MSTANRERTLRKLLYPGGGDTGSTGVEALFDVVDDVVHVYEPMYRRVPWSDVSGTVDVNQCGTEGTATVGGGLSLFCRNLAEPRAEERLAANELGTLVLIGGQPAYSRVVLFVDPSATGELGKYAFVEMETSVPATPAERACRPEDERQLARLGELSDGWYDGTSIAPSEAAREAARDVLSAMASTQYPSPFVAPLVDGGVELSWGGPTTDRLLAAISPDGAVRYVRAMRSEGGLEGGTAGDGGMGSVVSLLEGLNL